MIYFLDTSFQLVINLFLVELIQRAMESFTEKIVQMMKAERLFQSQGGPIILSQACFLPPSSLDFCLIYHQTLCLDCVMAIFQL